MATKTQKTILGILILVVLTASIYVLVPEKVRIDVEKTRTTFKVWENNSWVLGGTEYTKIYDGTTLMRANNRVVNYTIDLEYNKTVIYRYSYFKDNILVIDSYEFEGNVKDVGLVPVSHKINVINGQGKILVYEVNDLFYTGETKKDIFSPQSFGHNMKVEWESGNYYSRIWKYAGKDVGKLEIKYRPDSSDYSVNVRLFDPEKIRGIEHTLTTDKICDKNGKCILTLYSGIRNVYEDNTWKRIENARSLKGSGIECVINSDGENLVECIDWNYTSITLRLSQKSVSLTNKEVPIKIYSYNKSGDLNLKSEIKERFNLLSNQKERTLNNFRYGDIIHFGEKSTTIQLQDADTENLEDLSFYGGNSNCAWFIKFNITQVPVGQTIENVTISVFPEKVNTPDTDVTFKNLINQTWTEDDDANSTFNSGFSGEINQSDFYIDDDVWATSTNLEELFSIDYDASHSYFSLYLQDPDYIPTGSKTGDPGAQDVLRFGYCQVPIFAKEEWQSNSKETATPANRPYLNITYSEEAPPDTCTYTNGNWNILCSDYCNITSNVAAGAGVNNITITGAGTFTTTANITGFKNFFATGGAGQCTIRCLNGGCFK